MIDTVLLKKMIADLPNMSDDNLRSLRAGARNGTNEEACAHILTAIKREMTRRHGKPAR